MARPTSYIGTSEAEDRSIVLKQCPVTCGLPTRMTEKGFNNACKHQRTNLVAWNGYHKKEERLTWCGVCRGKKRPAELEIIPLADLQQSTTKGETMSPAKKRIGNCSTCAAKRTAVIDRMDRALCNNCVVAYTSVSQRLGTVIQAIVDMGKADEALKLLGGDAVAVLVENDALKAIAEIVGYQGEDGDGLLEAVRTFGLHEPTELPLDLIKAIDCTADDWEMDAIHTAALLEQAIGQHVIDAGLINQQKNDLGALMQAFDKLKTEHGRIKEEYTMTVDRLHELEQQHAAHLQVFAQLADLVEGSPEYPAELPARFAALLSKAATDAIVGAGHASKLLPQSSAIDSHLLDLVLDFPGIPLERIAVIREAV